MFDTDKKNYIYDGQYYKDLQSLASELYYYRGFNGDSADYVYFIYNIDDISMSEAEEICYLIREMYKADYQM